MSGANATTVAAAAPPLPPGAWLDGAVWGLQVEDTRILFAACYNAGSLWSELLALFVLLPLYVFVGVSWLFLSHKELLLWVSYTLSYVVTFLVARVVADTLRVERPPQSAPCTSSYAVPDAWFIATTMYLALSVVYPYVYDGARAARRPLTHALLAIVAILYGVALAVNHYLTWAQLGINVAIVVVATAIWFTFIHTLVVPHTRALLRLPAIRWLSFESDVARAPPVKPRGLEQHLP